jgi:hypothetical protein
MNFHPTGFVAATDFPLKMPLGEGHFQSPALSIRLQALTANRPTDCAISVPLAIRQMIVSERNP